MPAGTAAVVEHDNTCKACKAGKVYTLLHRGPRKMMVMVADKRCSLLLNIIRISPVFFRQRSMEWEVAVRFRYRTSGSRDDGPVLVPFVGVYYSLFKKKTFLSPTRAPGLLIHFHLVLHHALNFSPTRKPNITGSFFFSNDRHVVAPFSFLFFLIDQTRPK